MDGAPEIRVLAQPDTDALWGVVNRDATANVFMASQLESSRSAARSPAGGEVLGLFRGGTLESACWTGVNLVPIGVQPSDGAALGTHLAATGRKFSSIFGPSAGVLSIWSTLGSSSPDPFDLRPTQPLMEITGPPAVEPMPGLRYTRPDEVDILLPACAAMFEEEVGYSPFVGGGEHYRRRVESLVRRRHSLMELDAGGRVIFKAELGTVSRSVVQIQGVWMNPCYRGRGLSAGYMAAVVLAARRLAPVVSLYVNSFNERAIASYRSVGFTEVGNFATVLF